MATAFASQSRNAGTYASPDVAVSLLASHPVQVLAVGISDPTLGDATLALSQTVEANNAATGNPGGWYPIYGPDVWTGGNTGKDGLPLKPGFTFRSDSTPAAAVRLRLSITSNKTATWGFDATVL